MSLTICSINSGSNGNCYYVGNETEAVIIDAGLTCRETEKRMKRAGLLMEKVKAIFISHEHGDHIKGVEVLSAKHKLPVYITEGTLRHSRLKLDKERTMPLDAYQKVYIGGLTIHTFPKFHDAADPHSFVIEGNGVKIGVLTDIGSVCKHVVEHFKQCHAAFLEANYDDEMLEKGRYPYHLKKRIQGDEGHLSNKQALDLFRQYKPVYMSHLLLSHLSKDNNSPKLALDTFRAYAGNTHVVVASRDEESAVYHVTTSEIKAPVIRIRPAKSQQISLF
ncbi:MAG: MBL fold metallo-hydrolase [Flavipsychrobacter sp.]|nr:MBL fold metallo-hydrolase [Flavipsychrobacter sp.]